MALNIWKRMVLSYFRQVGQDSLIEAIVRELRASRLGGACDVSALRLALESYGTECRFSFIFLFLLFCFVSGLRG